MYMFRRFLRKISKFESFCLLIGCVLFPAVLVGAVVDGVLAGDPALKVVSMASLWITGFLGFLWFIIYECR
jgi:hypothetical protein